MATVISRRFLPPRHERIATRPNQPTDDGAFFLGLAYALPFGVFLWLSLGLALNRLI